MWSRTAQYGSRATLSPGARCGSDRASTRWSSAPAAGATETCSYGCRSASAKPTREGRGLPAIGPPPSVRGGSFDQPDTAELTIPLPRRGSSNPTLSGRVLRRRRRTPTEQVGTEANDRLFPYSPSAFGRPPGRFRSQREHPPTACPRLHEPAALWGGVDAGGRTAASGQRLRQNLPTRRVAERLGLINYGVAVNPADHPERLAYADRPIVGFAGRGDAPG